MVVITEEADCHRQARSRPRTALALMPWVCCLLALVIAACGHGAITTPAATASAGDFVGVWFWQNSHGQGEITMTLRADGQLAVRDVGQNSAQGWDQSFVLSRAQVAQGECVFRETHGGFEAHLQNNGHLLVTLPQRECTRESQSGSP